MGTHEVANIVQSLNKRADAWDTLGRLELRDCRRFHCLIDERRWHCQKPKVTLQPTWRPLLLLLMTYLGKSVDTESLRDYQREHWGMLNGETCVIELSGLAAPNLNANIDRNEFLPERIAFIRGKIAEMRPKLVVMYGRKQRQSWEQIAEREFPPEPDPFSCKSSTLFCSAPHPSRPIKEGNRYLGNEYWSRLGSKLRSHRCISAYPPA